MGTFCEDFIQTHSEYLHSDMDPHAENSPASGELSDQSQNGLITVQNRYGIIFASLHIIKIQELALNRRFWLNEGHSIQNVWANAAQEMRSPQHPFPFVCIFSTRAQHLPFSTKVFPDALYLCRSCQYHTPHYFIFSRFFKRRTETSSVPSPRTA